MEATQRVRWRSPVQKEPSVRATWTEHMKHPHFDVYYARIEFNGGLVDVTTYILNNNLISQELHIWQLHHWYNNNHHLKALSIKIYDTVHICSSYKNHIQELCNYSYMSRLQEPVN